MYSFIPSFSYLGLNQRPLNEADFFNILDTEGIDLIEENVSLPWYMVVDDCPFIVLPNKITGYERLFGGFHELAHHFRSIGRSPQWAFFSGLSHSRDEVEADAFALVAICPLSALITGSLLEESDDPFLKWIYEERKKLYMSSGT